MITMSIPKGAQAEQKSSGQWSEHWAVVLAGGRGTRLENFLRQLLGSGRPEQFSRIVGTRSMLRHTWDRAARVVTRNRILTVVTADQEHYLEEEGRTDVPGTVVVQPADRGTAAGLLLPLLWIARRSPAATVIIFPADHFIWEEDQFEGHIRAAMSAAEHLSNRLILLGAEANGPDPEHSWIALGEPLEVAPAIQLYAVRRFWEKPEPAMAAHLFNAGHLWNTRILAGRLDAYFHWAEAGVSEVLNPLHAIATCLDTPAEAAALAAAYRHLPSTSFSHALLTRHPEALLVLAARNVYWSDWGDPDEVVHTLRRFELHPTWLRA